MVRYSDTDIIVAPATPVIKAPLTVIRVSGSECWNILTQYFQPKKGEIKSWQAKLGDWRDEKGHIDEVVVVPMAKGNSYTGQEMFEVTCHGNPVLVQAIMTSMKLYGVRLAEPGEFTSRAVLSGKMSLFEAERVQALIEAKTRYHAQIIYQQEHDPFIPFMKELVEKILKIQAHIEASIDYGEEDIEALQYTELVLKIETVIRDMDGVLKASVLPKKLRDGFQVLLTGHTNVGKSSLFNALCDHQRAIVTDIHGTTRDLVHEEVELRGVPVVFIDSAGIRETDDHIEKIGIERIKKILPQMDLVLLLSPCGEYLKTYPELESIPEARLMLVKTKSDLLSSNRKEDGAVSIEDEMSIKSLKDAIIQKLVGDGSDLLNQHYLVTQRQEIAFENARKELVEACEVLNQGFGEEICASHLNTFRNKIGELTGETTVENILDHMFSDFCLGK